MPEYAIGIRIGSESDDRALSETEALLGRVARKQEEAAQATKSHQGAAKSLAGTIKDELTSAFGNLVAIGTFTKFLWDGMRAAVEEERALRQLSGMARQFGQDGTAAANAAKALGDSLQKVGYDDDEVLSAVRELLPLTRDYQQAVSAVSLAYDINARTGMPVAQALALIQHLIAGDERGLKTLMRELGISATTTGEGLQKVEKDFLGAAAALDDKQASISSAKAELDDLGKEIGGPLSDALIFAIKWIKGLGNAWAGVGLAAYSAAQFVALAGRSVVNAAKRDFDAISTDFRETMALLGTQWDEWGTRFHAQVFGGTADAGGPQPPIKPRKSGGGDTDAKNDPWVKQMLERIKWMQTEQEARERVEDHLQKINRETVEDAKRGYKERLAAARKAAKDEEALSSRLHAGQVALNEAETELKIKNAAAAKDAALSAAAMTMGAMYSMFPKMKGFAIAEALINTYQGVTRVLAEWAAYPPVAAALAAATIATGMAQVMKIQSIEPGSGGGGGGSPSGMRSSGPSIYSAGRSGATGSEGGKTTISTVNNQNAPGQQITINALTGNQAAIAHREFERTKGAGVRQANRAIVNRGRTTITQAGR